VLRQDERKVGADVVEFKESLLRQAKLKFIHQPHMCKGIKNYD
jgi:hypothetical protein